MSQNGRTMRALVKKEAGPGLSLVEVPVPQVGPKDVLIAVEKVGVCGTDVHIYDWDAWASGRVKPGTIIGHEFMGRVVEVGPAVDAVKAGDRVSGEGHIGCGRCYSCRTGDAHICDRVDIIGIDVDGCFADFVRMPEENVWRLDPSVPDRVGAIFDPLGNAMHTVMRDDISGKTALVVGAGTIGLMIVGIAKAAGAIDVTALDTNPKKLELAKAMGADAVFDARDPDLIQRVIERTRGNRGVDVMLEASGSPQGIRTGIKCLRSGGWAALLGIPAEDVPFNLAEDVVFKGITIHGVNGRKMYETWYQVEDFLAHGKLDVEPLITHQLPLERFEEAFDLIKSGEAIKVVMDVATGRSEGGEG